MINMLSVRPPPPPAPDPDGAGGDDQLAGASSVGEQEEIVDLKEALFADPIVGVELVVADEHGPGALPTIPLATPHPMTPAELARHNLTHLPFSPWVSRLCLNQTS